MVRGAARLRRRRVGAHAGFTGTDTFSYTLRDNGPDNIGGNDDDLTNTSTVTITVGAQKVWYVDSSYTGALRDGRSATPFTTLAAVSGSTAPDAAGDILCLSAGNSATTPYSGGVKLLSNQTLLGQGASLVVGTLTLQAAGANPIITNSGGAGVTLGSGDTLPRGALAGAAEIHDQRDASRPGRHHRRRRRQWAKRGEDLRRCEPRRAFTAFEATPKVALFAAGSAPVPAVPQLRRML